MATITIFGDAADGSIDSSDPTYSTARSGGTLTTHLGPVQMTVGQAGGYTCHESFLAFDTSSLAALGTLLSTILSLAGWVDASTTADFTCEVRPDSWGPTLTTADWVAGASLGGLTPLLATFDTTGMATGGTYNDFTESGTALTAALNTVGFTYLLVNSNRHRNGDTPAPGNEYVQFYSTEQTAGTTTDPKLVVTYTPPAFPHTYGASVGVLFPNTGSVFFGSCSTT